MTNTDPAAQALGIDPAVVQADMRTHVEEPVGPDSPYSIDSYLKEAKETTAAEPEYTFEQLPDVCAELLEVTGKAAADMATVRDLVAQLEGELYYAAILDDYFKTQGATNEKSRDAVFTKMLSTHQGYQALLKRQEDIRLVQTLADANYKRYSRKFEVMKMQFEAELLTKRTMAIGETLGLMPSMDKALGG